MIWLAFVLGAVVSWGIYGSSLHRGQVLLGHPLRALLCVGVAYFMIGVLVPAVTLWQQGELKGFHPQGTTAALLAGALGALGAICIIWSFKSGGAPLYVMPLVFGGAPLVNVLVSLWVHPPKSAPHPLLFVGFLLASIGAGMVLYYRPPS